MEENQEHKSRTIIMKQEEQKQFMDKLEKEIKDLEKQIKNIKIINFKNQSIRNIKFSAKVLQLIAPYILMTGISFFGYKELTHDTPFKRDSVPVYEHIQMDFDNRSNVQYKKQFGKFADEKNSLYYRSKWNKIEDGFYERVIQTYAIPYKSYEEVLPLFEKEPTRMETILGYPNSSVTEVKNNLTEEEINEQAYIEVTLYSKNGEKFIMGEQSMEDNIAETLLYLLITSIFELTFARYTTNVGSNFTTWVEDLYDRYQPMDENMLRGKLNIKIDNYLRLGGSMRNDTFRH